MVSLIWNRWSKYNLTFFFCHGKKYSFQCSCFVSPCQQYTQDLSYPAHTVRNTLSQIFHSCLGIIRWKSIRRIHTIFTNSASVLTTWRPLTKRNRHLFSVSQWNELHLSLYVDYKSGLSNYLQCGCLYNRWQVLGEVNLTWEIREKLTSKVKCELLQKVFICIKFNLSTVITIWSRNTVIQLWNHYC